MQMKKLRIGAFWILLLIVALACGEKSVIAKPEEKPDEQVDKGEGKPEKTLAEILKDYKLIWQDEFDGSVLDTKKWKYRAEGTVRQYATVSSRTISLDGKGNLVITVEKDKEGKYYVGQVCTDGLFQAKYGYYECRARMNKTIGPHVAFWLQTNTMGNENDNPADNGAEIDIFEYHKMTSNQVHHNIHWNGYGAAHKQAGTKAFVDNIEQDFHTFGLLWTDKEYIFYVDGKETWRTTEALSKIPEYIILSTELTGFGGNPTQGTYPDSVIYDYVRVYQDNSF